MSKTQPRCSLLKRKTLLIPIIPDLGRYQRPSRQRRKHPHMRKKRFQTRNIGTPMARKTRIRQPRGKLMRRTSFAGPAVLDLVNTAGNTDLATDGGAASVKVSLRQVVNQQDVGIRSSRCATHALCQKSRNFILIKELLPKHVPDRCAQIEVSGTHLPPWTCKTLQTCTWIT